MFIQILISQHSTSKNKFSNPVKNCFPIVVVAHICIANSHSLRLFFSPTPARYITLFFSPRSRRLGRPGREGACRRGGLPRHSPPGYSRGGRWRQRRPQDHSGLGLQAAPGGQGGLQPRETTALPHPHPRHLRRAGLQPGVLPPWPHLQEQAAALVALAGLQGLRPKVQEKSQGSLPCPPDQLHQDSLADIQAGHQVCIFELIVEKWMVVRCLIYANVIFLKIILYLFFLFYLML